MQRAACFLIITTLILSLGVWCAAKSSAVADTAKIGTKTINVIVLIFDPVLKTKQDQKLHEYKNWSDPRELSHKMVADVFKSSEGYVKYNIVECIEYDGFTQFRDGFTYTEDQFLNVIDKDSSKAHPGMTSFKWMFDKFDLVNKIKKKNATEIWLWGAPYMSWDELHWKIPGDKIPYQTDNPWFYRPYDVPDVGKTIWIMGWNYERGEGEMLESYGHRIESVLSLTVGKGIWDHKKNGENPWVKFTRVDQDFPGEAEVGSVHSAPNSAGGYDWDNKTNVWTYADDWFTYPNLPRNKKLLNNESGGWGTTADAPSIVNHHIWWMNHIPHNPGVTDGFYNNWWQYIVNYDEAIKKLPPPGATFQKAKTAMYSPG